MMSKCPKCENAQFRTGSIHVMGSSQFKTVECSECGAVVSVMDDRLENELRQQGATIRAIANALNIPGQSSMFSPSF